MTIFIGEINNENVCYTIRMSVSVSPQCSLLANSAHIFQKFEYNDITERSRVNFTDEWLNLVSEWISKWMNCVGSMLFDWLKPENRKETFYGKKRRKMK